MIIKCLFAVITGLWTSNPVITTIKQQEILIDSNVVDTPVDYAEFAPQVAFNGTYYMAVWEDYRNNADTADIYGARITASGTVLDPLGIPISTAANAQRRPCITSDGNNFFVVWEDYRNNADTADIYGARITASGTVLDPSGIPISTAAYNQLNPEVTSDTNDFFVVWEDYRNNADSADIYGARITASGTVLDPSGIPISTAAYNQLNPDVSFDGTFYMVVWQDYRSGFIWSIYMNRLTTAGGILDGDGKIISTQTNNQQMPAISYDGLNYFVIRTCGSYIYGSRITSYGDVIDTPSVAVSGTGDTKLWPDIAFNGSNYVGVWETSNANGDDIYGASFSTAADVLDSFAVSTQSGYQYTPSITSGTANQVLIVYSGWIDSINSQPVHTWRIWGKFYPVTNVLENNAHKSPGLDISVIPSIAESYFTINITSCSNLPITISLFNTYGKKVFTLSKDALQSGMYKKRFKIPGNTPQGIYFVRVETGHTAKCTPLLITR